MKFRIGLIIICISLLSSQLLARNSFVVEDFKGISELLQTRCITQDDDGKIWFGTDKYLYSFDGYEISSFISDEGNIVSSCIFIDEKRVFLGSNNGLYIYDPYTDSFYKTDILKDAQIKSIVRCNGNIYVASDSGAYIIEADEEYRNFKTSCIMTGNISCMKTDGLNLLLGMSNGLYSYSSVEKTVKVTISYPREVATTNSIYTEENNIWVGTHRYVIRKSRHGEAAEYIPFTSVKCMHMDEHGHMLMATDLGLYRYDTVSEDSEIVHKGIVWDFFEDKDGNIWMASDNGLLMHRQRSIFRPVLSAPDIKDGYYNKIHLDAKGRLWLGGQNGLALIENYKSTDFSLSTYSALSRENFIPHNKIRNIRENGTSGEILLATDAGCLKFDEKTGTFQSRLRINRPRTYSYDILADGDYLWVGTFSGLYKIDSNNEIAGHWSTDDGLSDKDIPTIAKDRQGNTWMLTRDQKIHVLKEGLIQRKDFSDIASRPLASCLISDSDSDIWIGVSNRIMRFSSVDEFKSVNINASEAVEIYSMTDIGQELIACTSEGIFSISKDDMHIHGLNSPKTYVCCAYDKANDILVFSGPAGVDIISASRIPELYSSNAHKAVITRIVINGSHDVPYSQKESMNLNLPHKQNSIRVYISDFQYHNTSSPKFSYQLTSKRTNLHETVSSNSIMFADMKPGRYTLSISNSEDNNQNLELLKIRIRQPWYSSTPMILLYLLAALAIIILINHTLNMKQRLLLQKMEQEQTNEQMRQKEDFFISFAHEFKTPLSLIIAPLGKLIKESTNQNELYTLQLAQKNAIMLNGLIHRTLDYYSEDKGVVNSLISTEVELVEFAKSIFTSYQENYKEHEFIFSSSQAEITAYVDIVKVETILNNLMSNACKYTPEGGSIIMSLEKIIANDEIMIKVSDTGIGIPQKELPFVFQRYFESSRSKNGNYNSTGVGLSIIKRYVEMHGGSIKVDSDNIGTTFTLVMPCMSQNISSVEVTKSESADDSNKPLVVIIDDNVQICKFLESVLSDKYRCVSSHNGKSGLKLCTDLIPDLIISDVMMPVMDGLEMCQKIREIPALSSVPIILLTAKGDHATEKASISMNIEAFIAKPFDITTLTGRVDQLIGNKKRIEQKLRIEMISTPQDPDELSQDEKYFKKVTQLIEENLDDSDFNVSKLCSLGDFNEKQLYRKLKQFTGMSVVEYIRTIRLKKAAILLQNGKFTVSEVMYTVGFSNASYFSRSFQAAYGKTPSEYMKQYKNQA